MPNLPWERNRALENNKKLQALLDLDDRQQRLFEAMNRPREEKRSSAYAEAALQKEIQAVLTEPSGNRNNRLNDAALALGTLVGSGLLNRQAVEQGLLSAALANGLGEAESRRTIRSGLEAGIREPRTLPEENGHGENGKPKPSVNGESTEKKSVPFTLPIPASELQRSSLARWLWKGYLARGGITLMSALWKAGKTTFLAHLMRAMAEGGEFCGLPIDPGRVLCVTEESESRWADRRDSLGLRDHIEFLIRPFGSKPRWERWQEFLTYLEALCQKKPYDLIIFDTLVNLWPVRDENDAAQVQSALMPLHKVAEQSSLMLVHHTRKGDGTEAVASRGSGALTAFVDTIVELRRFHAEDRKDRKRILSGYGRYDETPDELVIELSELDGYIAHGTKREATSKNLFETIRELLPPAPPGITIDEILEMWPNDQSPRKQSLLDSLRDGADKNLWIKTGEGKRGRPFMFWRPR
jgi:hypothetical protein